MFRVHPRALLLTLIALVVFVAGPSAPLAAQDATPGTGEVTILGPDEEYAGASLGEWDARWWQWTSSFPEEVNPSFDPTGERCGYGQSGPVFFLPANYTDETAAQTCVVPEGMAIFAPVGGVLCSDDKDEDDEEELRACAAEVTDLISDVEASVNGEEVPELESYRTTSPLFTMNLLEDNILGTPAGVEEAVSDQYHFIIAPPPPGEYEIVLTAKFEDEPEPLPRTIRVIVQAPQIIEPEATPEGSPEVATPVT